MFLIALYIKPSGKCNFRLIETTILGVILRTTLFIDASLMTHPDLIQHLEAQVSQLRHQPYRSIELVDAINALAMAQVETCAHKPEVKQLLLESFELAQHIQYNEGQVRSLIGQSWQFVLQGEPERGMPSATQAIELAQTCADARLEAIARYATSLVQAEIGSMALSLENQLTALTLVQEIGDVSREADYRTAIGLHYLRSNQYAHASEHFTESIRVYRVIESKNLPIALNNLAMVHLYQGDYKTARGYIDDALLLGSAESRIRSILLHTLGEVYLRMGNDYAPQAQDYFQQALALQNNGDIDDQPTRADILLSWAKLLTNQGQYDGALKLLLDLADNAREHQRKPILAQTIGEIYRTYKQAGQYSEALLYCEQYYELRTELESASAERQVRTLYIMHETREARRAAEIMRLKTVVLERMVLERTRDLERTQMEMLQRLAMAVETRDAITGDHVVRVGDLAAKIATQYGMSDELVGRIQLAARLHDLGKIGIPDNILMKEGRLDADEYHLMKSHTVKGASILANSPMPLFQAAEEIALTHHERWDGQGYPHRLKGENIPITGRIVAVADAFDAMTSLRPYKSVISVAEAIAEIMRCSGTQFDPAVVQAFIRVITPELDMNALDYVVTHKSHLALPAEKPSEKAPVPALPTNTTAYYWSVPLRTVDEPSYTASVSAYYK